MRHLAEEAGARSARTALRPRRKWLGVLACSLWLVGCGDQSSGADAGLADYTKQGPPAAFLTLASTAGRPRYVPAGEIAVRVLVGAPRANVEAAARAAGGKIVGQIATLGYYEIEIPTTTQAQLDAAIATIRQQPGIAGASYQTLVHTASCPPSSGADRLSGSARCPHILTDYFTGLTIFEGLEAAGLALVPVTVAVVDTGLDVAGGSFGEVAGALINVTEPGAAPQDDHVEKHGTAVAQIIAADEDAADGRSGIARRFLKDKLTLAVATTEGFASPANEWVTRTSTYLLAAQKAAELPAKVVNLSLVSRAGDEPETQLALQDGSAVWRELFTQHPMTLFVIAAGNDGRSASQSLPAAAQGLAPLENVLVVGAVESCSKQPAPWSGADADGHALLSNSGTIVEVVAPGTIHGHSGTSFAAPQVSSLAAILLAMQADLIPAAVKPFILADHSGMTPDGTPRISLTHAVTQLVVSNHLAGSTLVDPLGYGLPWPPGWILNRLCGGFSAQLGSFMSVQCYGAGGVIEAGRWSILSAQFYDSCALRAGAQSFCADIQVPSALPLSPEGCATAGIVALDALSGGNMQAGTVELASCRIDQRQNGRPFIVEVKGSWSGMGEYSTASDPGNLLPAPFSASFDVGFEVIDGYLGEDDLEASCENGLKP